MTDRVFIHNSQPIYREHLFSYLEKNDVKIIFTSDLPWYKLISTYFSLRKSQRIVIGLSHDLKILVLSFLLVHFSSSSIALWSETWNWKCFSIKQRFFHTFLNKLLLRANYVIYPGISVLRHYIELGIPVNKMIFAPNTSYIQRLKSHTPLFTTMISRGLSRKGIELFILTAKLLPKEVFLLVTDPKYIEHHGIQLPRNVIFIDNTILKPSTALSLSKSLIVPSRCLGMGEPWGLIINEALIYNIPIITTSTVGSSYDLIENGVNGIVLRSISAQNIAKSIIICKMMKRELLKKKNAELLDRYSNKHMFAGFSFCFT